MTLRSPFALESWEPRFVVEHYREDAVRAGIELWWMCSAPEFGSERGVRYLSRRGDRFLARHPRCGRPLTDGWEELAEPMTAEQLTASILSWRDSAAYPERPSFDGSEVKGFILFWGYFGYEEQERDTRGALIVLPKWFEIHK